jgi:hypothetical protein
MRQLQRGLRALIAVGSLAGFFGGWALLAHANKPVPLEPAPAIVAPAPLPTLAPLPQLSPLDRAPSSLQPLPALPPQPQVAMPRLRTRGS